MIAIVGFVVFTPVAAAKIGLERLSSFAKIMTIARQGSVGTGEKRRGEAFCKPGNARRVIGERLPGGIIRAVAVGAGSHVVAGEMVFRAIGYIADCG